MNVFNGVTSPRVFFYRRVLPVGFNLIYGLKSQSQWHQNCRYLQTIHFQVEWLIAALIDNCTLSYQLQNISYFDFVLQLRNKEHRMKVLPQICFE